MYSYISFNIEDTDICYFSDFRIKQINSCAIKKSRQLDERYEVERYKCNNATPVRLKESGTQRQLQKRWKVKQFEKITMKNHAVQSIARFWMIGLIVQNNRAINIFKSFGLNWFWQKWMRRKSRKPPRLNNHKKMKLF